ncbi:MAG: adenylate/guanylate cyclase domain-containing protein [candidate division FCPU426 bacterium]
MPSSDKKPNDFVPSDAARSRGRLVAAAALLALTATVLFALGPGRRLEWLATDWLQRVQAGWQPPQTDLAFVVLDQKSLDVGEAEFGLTWPWPRESYAQALDFLNRAGAKIILFDFTFSEPSSYQAGDDETLAASLHSAGNVYLPVITYDTGSPATTAHLASRRPELFLHPAMGPGLRQAPRQSVNLPVDPLLSAVAGLGEARFQPDADGVQRRVEPLVMLGSGALPALGLAPWMPARTSVSVGQNRLQIGGRSWPLDSQGRLVLRYPGRWQSYPRASLSDVIKSNVLLQEGQPPLVEPGRFRGKVVVIGSTAAGLMDLRKTPLDTDTPGFFVSAALWAAGKTNQAYDETWRGRLAWPLAVLLIVIGAWAGTLSVGRGLLASGAALAGFLAAASLLFFYRGLLFDLLAPVLGLIVAHASAWGLSYRAEHRQKRFIQGAFSQVLSPTVLERLMQEPGRLHAGGELVEATVYFSDLAGFTTVSESLDPRHLVEVLNLYLGEMVATIVDEQQGYVDKFIGDAVMAFWGAPLPDPDQAYRACVSALRNQDRLAALQGRLRDLGLPAGLSMRIGLHTGPVVVGMMGSPKKLNYTVIGDTVNLASRLEGANKQYGTRILASGDLIDRVAGRVVAREVDRIRVKGKTQPTRLFELVGLQGQVGEDLMQFVGVYSRGLELYYQRSFAAARRQLEEALKLRPEDEPARVLVERCRAFSRKRPPKDWDGVTTLTSK